MMWSRCLADDLVELLVELLRVSGLIGAQRLRERSGNLRACMGPL